MRKALAAIYFLAASLALASDLGGDGLGGPTLQPRANSAQLGEPGLSNRETAQVDPVLIEAGEPALDFRFAENKWMRDSVTNKQSLITFSRPAAQSPGTYVGADGLIKTAAVNLQLYSEEFDQWTNSNTTDLANQVDAPDGKQTADEITASAANGTIVRGVTTTAISYTFSVWLKRKTGTGDIDISVDGSTWVTQSVTSDWQRFSVTQTGVAGTSNAGIRIVTSGDEVYAWGAQLEEGSTATPYIHTTSQALAAPRFDHDPVTGESLGLLVEEARANAFTESEFRNGYVADSALRSGLLSDVSFSGLFQNTGVAFGHDGATTSYLYKSGVATSSTVTLSVFVRMDDGLAPSFGSSTNSSSSNDFILVMGNAVPSPPTYSVEDYGNGLYRVVAIGTSGTSSTNTGVLKYGSNSSRTFKVSGYQIENGVSFPTSYIPTVTSQTRYADVAAVQDEDFATTNLLAYSESFDVGWYSAGITFTPNDIVSPDGQQTADKLAISSSDTFGQQLTVAAGTTITYTVHIKRGNNQWVRFGVWDSSGGVPSGANQFRAWVDLQNKQLGTVSSIGSASVVGASVEDIGDGWLKASITGRITSTSTIAPIVVTANADNSATRVSGVEYYLWGASLTATEYPVAYTTTRNLLTDSQDFERSTWVKAAATIDNDVAQAPDGTITADRIADDATYGVHNIKSVPSVTPTGKTVTFSAYVKAQTAQAVRLNLQTTGANYSQASFDLQNEVTVSSTGGDHSASSSSISSVGNGWFRISLTSTLGADTSWGSYGAQIRTEDPYLNHVYAGTGKTLLIWGAQLEPGTTATDYVRTVDVVGKAYQWFEPTEGTVFVETVPQHDNFKSLVDFGIVSTTNRNTLALLTIPRNANAATLVGGLQMSATTSNVFTLGQSTSVSTAFAKDDLAISLNGGPIASDTPGEIYGGPILMTIGQRVDKNVQTNGHIKRLTYWPVRQSNSTLQVITQ